MKNLNVLIPISMNINVNKKLTEFIILNNKK